MLVNHAHTVTNRIQGVLKADGLTLQHNLPLGWFQKAEKHFHQGGFSGAVFSKQRMNGATLAGKPYIAVGGKAVGIDDGDVVHQ